MSRTVCVSALPERQLSMDEQHVFLLPTMFMWTSIITNVSSVAYTATQACLRALIFTPVRWRLYGNNNTLSTLVLGYLLCTPCTNIEYCAVCWVACLHNNAWRACSTWYRIALHRRY